MNETEDSRERLREISAGRPVGTNGIAEGHLPHVLDAAEMLNE